MSRLQLHFPIGSIPTLICGHPGLLKFCLPLHVFKFHHLHHFIIHPSHFSLLLHAPIDQSIRIRFNCFVPLMINQLPDIVNLIKHRAACIGLGIICFYFYCCRNPRNSFYLPTPSRFFSISRGER
jgi:hypothetical protein